MKKSDKLKVDEGGLLVKLRVRTLWKVPLFCFVAGWLSFYATVYLGRFFFVVQKMEADGVIQYYPDPFRPAIFNGVLFLLVLLAGGLWAFRDMTKKEIAVSSAITSAFYLILVLCQMMVRNFPISVILTYIQNWVSIPNSFLFSLTGNLAFSAIFSSFTPLLFIPFGKKGTEDSKKTFDSTNAISI